MFDGMQKREQMKESEEPSKKIEENEEIQIGDYFI